MIAPVALTCGEPAGIGPEIAVKAWAELRDSVPFFWIGDPRHLSASAEFQVIADPGKASDICAHALPVLCHPFAEVPVPGYPAGANAQGVLDAIARGVDVVQSGAACALCTTPIHKKVLLDGAAFAYPGHTEYLAALTGTDRVVMMLASPAMRVVPTTIHIALEDVPWRLTPDLLRDTIRITADGLKQRFGLDIPRLAVAGLNPHAGEGGVMGRQELTWIAGLIADMAANGYAVTGPHPADTLFHAAARVRY
ncbi:MAG: 4-hydroxythreonine-4-phosphate dehydrogenase PdxA, partial [Rhodobacteraceae bacterium]|nr:4-hydroxythreonine-4-phosphate dehydrogenase PdxA [Paracoccaceae bacterium]